MTPYAAVGLKTCLIDAGCDLPAAQLCDPKGIIVHGGEELDATTARDSSEVDIPNSDHSD